MICAGSTALCACAAGSSACCGQSSRKVDHTVLASYKYNTIICMISFKRLVMQNPLWLARKKQGVVKDREQQLDFDTLRRSFPYYHGTSFVSLGVFRLQLGNTHLRMHDGGIYDICFAEAGPRLPEDVVNMSVCLLDINEQMHPVTILKARNQNREIYDISWTTVFARLTKYLEND